MGLDQLVRGEHLGLPYVGGRQHQLAGGKPGASAVHHLADALVTGIAGHQRKLVGVPSHVDDVEVAPADGRQIGPHQDLARPRVRERRLDALYTLELGCERRRHHWHSLTSVSCPSMREFFREGGAVVKPVEPRFRRACTGLTLLTDGNTIPARTVGGRLFTVEPRDPHGGIHVSKNRRLREAGD